MAMDIGPTRRRKQQIAQFARTHAQHIVVSHLDLTSKVDAGRVLALFDRWATARVRHLGQVEHERCAMAKLLANADHLQTEGLMLEMEGADVGFSLFEAVHNGFGISRFHKADPAVRHADVYLSDYMFRYLDERGCSLMSWEQDLGIAGLRYFKESFRPQRFLEKFTIRRPE